MEVSLFFEERFAWNLLCILLFCGYYVIQSNDISHLFKYLVAPILLKYMNNVNLFQTRQVKQHTELGVCLWIPLSKSSLPTCLIADLTMEHRHAFPAHWLLSWLLAWARSLHHLLHSLWGLWIYGHLGCFNNALTYTQIHSWCIQAVYIIKSKGVFPRSVQQVLCSSWMFHKCTKEEKQMNKEGECVASGPRLLYVSLTASIHWEWLLTWTKAKNPVTALLTWKHHLHTQSVTIWLQQSSSIC